MKKLDRKVVLGAVSAAVTVLLAACGGGDDVFLGAIPTNSPAPAKTNTPVPVNTNTPVPVNTNTPVPVITNTAAPGATAVPVNTNTPVPVNTNTPVPINTNTSVPFTNTPAPTATNTNTPVPTATNTNTPVPTATNTNTPVPTATNTNTPVPTATNTNTPVPTATNTPVATDTATPVPTATNTPVATNTATPVPTATNTPVATDTATPVPTATNTPVATDTATPVPTDTPTPTSTPTATSTPSPTPTSVSASPCVPAAISNGQTLKLKFHGVDGQVSGEGYYPTGDANLTYTFNAGNFTVLSSNPGGLHPNIPASENKPNPNYETYTGGSYNTSTFEVTADNRPVLYTQAEVDNIVNNQDFDTMMSKSFVGYEPSDWAQRLAKQLANSNVGDSVSMPIVLVAQGKLPSLLSMVSGDSLVSDPQNNMLRATMTVTATRQANGTVNGYANACQFSFMMTRPMTVTGILAAEQASPGGTYTSSDPALQSAADTAVEFLGGDLQEIDFDGRMGFEVYMPVISGTFATTSAIPFFPIRTEMNHLYGVSAPANPHITYSNLGGMLAEKATDPADGSDYLHMPAQQIWTYQP